MKIRVITISIHLIAWILLLMIPYLSISQVVRSFALNMDHFSFTPILVLSLVLIIIFYLNYFVLIPRFLLPQKYFLYAISFSGTLVIAFFLSSLIFNLSGMQPGAFVAANPILAKISPIARANAFFMLIIAVVASISLALGERLKQTQQEKLSAEISSLKSQINPHFLFNTLNNIYATALDTSPQTADMVEKLSEMMRYTMKEAQKDFVLLSDELTYITNFIELQRVRLDSGVKLDYNISGKDADREIAPMLLIPFVENAFKHGVNAEQESYITISVDLKVDILDLKVTNKKVSLQSETTEHSGIGIENTRRRLQLIYPSQHSLTIHETGAVYSVSLQISLQ